MRYLLIATIVAITLPVHAAPEKRAKATTTSKAKSKGKQPAPQKMIFGEGDTVEAGPMRGWGSPIVVGRSHGFKSLIKIRRHFFDKMIASAWSI